MATMLVPLASGGERRGEAGRPLAAFVAQVIACDQALAGHRARRRAAPGEASALYRARAEGGRAGPLSERRA